VDKTPAATARSSGGFEPEDRSLVVFVKRLTDPMVVQATLLVSLWFHQVPVNRSILILMILTFALTYPGTLPFRYKQIGLFGRIVSSWFLVVAALTLLGWAIKAQDLLPLEPIVLWAIATPFAVYAVHLLSPYIAPRVFRFQSVASGLLL
jgi:putative colanic acid biosysnthesis UDP-glucose lipid carrier transferase